MMMMMTIIYYDDDDDDNDAAVPEAGTRLYIVYIYIHRNLPMKSL